jgi:tetratricopeptide (TPR) repeat protein
MKRWLVFALLACSASASADPPAAPSADQQAAALYDEGKRHFDIGEYAAAIASWKQSYLLSNEPLLLFNIGQAYRLAGNCAEANRFYGNYKRANPTPPNAAELEQATSKCAGVAPATGDAESDAAPKATAATPPVEPVIAHPPTPPAPPPTPLVDDTAGHGLRLAGLIAIGAGAADGVVAIVAGAKASSEASTVAGQRTGTPWSAALAADQASGQSWQTRARVLGAIGGVAVIGGGVAWWLGHRAASSRVDVALGAGHAGVSWSCAF